MNQVQISEVVEALLTNDDILRRAMALRVKAHGIAPPDGWVLVPTEPTKKMCKSAHNSWWHDKYNDELVPEAIYKAMLAAAPKPEDV